MVTKRSNVKVINEVRDTLKKLDVDMAGVTRLKDLKGTPLEKAALNLLPSAKSIVVVGMGVFPEFLDLTSPERIAGTPNLNDLLTRHVYYLRGRLNRAVYDIALASHKAGLKALPLPGQGPSVDGRYLEAVISYKHAAQAAGLGSIGMSSLLVTEKYGPRVQFAVCLTEASLTSTTGSPQQQYCLYCNVCVGKCPAHAIGRPAKGEAYAINKFACRSYVEAAGGCSECMRVCPIASPIYN
jgi:epoxyqueuosine reductase